MSFADSVRAELFEIAPKHPCCRRALTAGVLLPAVFVADKNIAIRYRDEFGAMLAEQLIKQQYAKEPNIAKSGACGHRYWDLSFSAPAARKMLMQLRESTADVASVLKFSCDSCRSAFLRGAFLACGTVNDPHKSFHLEFQFSDASAAGVLARFLTAESYTPRTIARKNGVGIYFKDSGAVEDLVGLMGAQHTVFEIINSRIERDIRNNENRATNCVTKNIEKTISAAARQIDAIGKLMANGKLDSLSEGLRTTALVRYRNPDATLDELAAMHEPPISRSGLNHRLAKLLEAAED